MNRRRALMAAQDDSLLPVGYTQKTYIRVPNVADRYNAYILPGYTMNNVRSAIVTFKFYGTPSNHIAISRSRNSPYGCIRGANNGFTRTSVTNDDGTTTATLTRTGSSGAYATYIISGWNDTSWTGLVDFYRFTIINTNDKTIFDGVPAMRDADAEYGLYDLVSKTFYPSSGSVSFEGG